MSVFISQFVTEILVLAGAGPPTPPSPPPVRTGRFDAGLGNSWYLVPQLDDSGDNLRDKTIKAFVATGKMTAPQFSIYGYGPGQDINVSDIEQGINSSSGKKSLPSTTQVQRTARRPIRVVNSMLHTCRLEGVWDGQGIKDRIDEIVYEVARQGVRR